MIKDFGNIATKLSTNPLGIIGLFIVLVYGIAGFVLGSASDSLTPNERLPLIWFLVLFPPVVLLTFSWLVARHHPKLYSPSDYPDPSDFLRAMDPEAQRRKLDREVQEIEGATASSVKTPLPSPSETSPPGPIRSASLPTRLLIAEDLALRELGAEFNASIQRQVGLANMELDGLFIRDGEAFGIEVKYFRRRGDVKKRVESLLRKKAVITRHHWKRFNFVFAAVIDDTESDSDSPGSIEAEITKELLSLNLKPEIRFYRFSDLLKKYGATP